jgi:hypothetical protein
VRLFAPEQRSSQPGAPSIIRAVTRSRLMK